MLSDRCPSVWLSGPICPVLSVTLVYYDQTVGWIKMPLGTEVNLGRGHIVLDGEPAPLPWKGAQQSPVFGPCLLLPNGRPSQLLLITYSNCLNDSTFEMLLLLKADSFLLNTNKYSVAKSLCSVLRLYVWWLLTYDLMSRSCGRSI